MDVVDLRFALGVKDSGGSGRNPGLFAQAQLLNQEKNGRVSDDPSPIKFAQDHSGGGHMNERGRGTVIIISTIGLDLLPQHSCVIRRSRTKGTGPTTSTR
jgi:hypothetical protein